MKLQQRLTAIPRSLLVILMLTSVLVTGNTAALAAPTPGYTITGKVTLLDKTTPVTDAVVIASQDGQMPQKSPVDGSGAYTIGLSTGGDWQVVVEPKEADPTQSPTWVYTDGPQTVSLGTTPGSVSLDLQVAQATAVVNGKLVVPVGSTSGTDFSGGNAARVRAANQEGQGNIVQVAADGSFSINVLPGNVIVRLALSNPMWDPSDLLAGSVWTAEDGTPLTIGGGTDPAQNALQLVAKQAQITGAVTNGSGHTVANIPVRAWRVDASEVETTASDSTGGYTVAVTPGTWQIWAVPADDDPNYVSGQSPQTVVIKNATDQKTQGLVVLPVDVTVTGQIVDANGNPVTGLKGRVIPTYLDKDGVHWRQFAQGTKITGDSFSLRLSTQVATQYRLHASFSDNSGYTEVSAPSITIVSNVNQNIKLPVAQNNASISGTIQNQNNAAVTGVPGAIYGASSGVAFKLERVNPVDGTYQFNIAASDDNGHGGTSWFLHAFIDPITNWFIKRPRNQTVFLPYNNGAGAKIADVNFTAVQINATIKGTVTDAAETPVPGARVSVWEQNLTKPDAFNRWDITNKNGNYSIAVPAGAYNVRVDIWKWGKNPLVSPAPVATTVAAGKPATVDLKFLASDATINGSVTYQGAAHTALVRAYSKDGNHIWALANPVTGGFKLEVSSGETWTVQAVSEDGTDFLRSDPQVVTAVAGKNLLKNPLELKKSDTLPGAVVFTFDAIQDQLLTLSDGAQVDIPAGAMAASGNVTVLVRPLPELADDEVAVPVSFGYRLLAYDSNHLPIDHFNALVTLRMPYTADQLAKLGVTPEKLIPSYWDIATNSWKPAPNYSLTLNTDGSGSLNLAVGHFTDYTILGTNPGFQVYLPMTAR